MIEEEISLIDEIYHIVSNGNVLPFDSLEYVYRINRKEGWSSIGVVYLLNGEIISQNDFTNIDEEALELTCEKLHRKMLENTGGDWQKFVLNFSDNRIKTNFSYEEQSLIEELP